MNWLDLGIILVALILIIIGLKKGFMTSMLSNFSFSINAIISFFLCKPVASIYNNWFGLGESIANSYSTRLLSESANFGKNLLEISKDGLHDFVSYTLSESSFSKFTKGILKLFINKPTLYDDLHASEHTSRTLADIVSSSFSTFFVTIIAFVTCVVLLYLIIWLFMLLVKKLRQIGFVKVVDNSLGAVYGAFRFFLVLVGLSFVIKLLTLILPALRQISS